MYYSMQLQGFLSDFHILALIVSEFKVGKFKMVWYNSLHKYFGANLELVKVKIKICQCDQGNI